ncbi:MAG: hypothetical protein ABW321_32755 [Polyangiales bacterium]
MSRPMETHDPTLRELLWKSALTHTLTYMVVGSIAAAVLDYDTWFSASQLRCFMRPTSSVAVMAGPLFQPLRGVLFGGVIYLLRDAVLGRRDGWLRLWLLLVVIGIVDTFGPTPGSIEGLIYTSLPLADQLRGLPEVLLQSLLLSFIVAHWAGRREPAWARWALSIVFALALALPMLGLLLRRLPA